MHESQRVGNDYCMWPPPGMPNVEYSDDQAVQAYWKKYKSWFSTEFEKRCNDLGGRIAKALSVLAQLPSKNEEFEKDFLEWESDRNADLRTALGSTSDEIRKNLSVLNREAETRIQTAILTGEIKIYRCPKCNRVVMSPSARQCMWCKHDWH